MKTQNSWKDAFTLTDAINQVQKSFSKQGEANSAELPF